MSASRSPEPGTERILRSTTRNPRRRQRQNDTDTLKTSAPRRKRSKITEETFQPRESVEVVEEYVNGALHDDHVAMNGSAHHPETIRKSNGSTSADTGDMEMALRSGKKGSVKRTSRGDGATLLAHNGCYNVKLLPSTPKELRQTGLEYRGSLGPANHALAVTKDKAIIWAYTAHTPPSNPRVLEVPFSPTSGDPLPFGALVPNGTGAANIGLFLLSAVSGLAVFYESIDHAASLGLFRDRRKGIDGSIGHLFGGETVTDLVSAGHAGFIIVLSSGRVAHLTLWDGQGKPRLQSQYLRTADPNAGGLFGSFKGFWNGGLYTRDLSAAHVRPRNTRGHAQVLSLAKRCEIAVWDLDWSGTSNFRGKFDFREVVVTELKAMSLLEPGTKDDNVIALDFAILDNTNVPHDLIGATIGTDDAVDLYILIQIPSLEGIDYVLVEIELSGDAVTVSRVNKITSLHEALKTKPQGRPRLLLPSPGHTAFVVLDQAIGVFATAQTIIDGPEAQLHTSDAQSNPFEDAIFLRSNMGLAIQSAVEEDNRGKQASLLTFVKGAGLVRLSASDTSGFVSGAKITIRERMEQAIFLGALQDGILDFSRRSDLSYDMEDVESAALAISDEILLSKSSFMPSSTAPISQQLLTKAQALKALVLFVRNNFAPLSPSSMWRLLSDAERVAAGQKLWEIFEDHVSTTSKGKRKATLMDELCTWFDNDETEHFPQRRDVAGEDPVRRFFIAGLHRLEKLLLNARVFLRDHRDHLHNQSSMGSEDVLQLVKQVNDVWLKSLESAFTFRSENAAQYGISGKFIGSGILADSADYSGLPEIWTSTEGMVNASVAIASLSREFATKMFEEETPPKVELLVRQISVDNPRIIQLYCLTCKECILWRASRSSEKDKEISRNLEASFDITRYEQFRGLAEVGQAGEGMNLAEKYGDMETLTDMVVAESQYLAESSHDASLTGDEKEYIEKTRTELDAKIRRLFDRYGEAWASPFFDMAFSSAAAGEMLVRAQQDWKDALTKYLRAQPSRAKICWINDITEGHDFSHAGAALAHAAKDQESRLWAKKVELSMSKLALLAAEESSRGSGAALLSNSSSITSPVNELAIAEIQDKLYKHIEPESGLLDRLVELDFCMQKFGTRIKGFSSLRQLLEAGFSMVLENTALTVEELIDVLTLMDTLNNEEIEDNLQGSEFCLSLVALNACGPTLPPARFEMLQQLIWKRCYIYDDWAELKFTSKQSDEERRSILRQTAMWHTFYQTLDEGFFEQQDCYARPLAPSECLGSACAPEDLNYRFPSEELLDPILHDLKIQDEMLASYVADRKLDEVAKECYRDAKAALEEDYREQARFAEGDTYPETELEHMAGIVNHTRMANGYTEDFPLLPGSKEVL